MVNLDEDTLKNVYNEWKLLIIQIMKEDGTDKYVNEFQGKRILDLGCGSSRCIIFC